jgi:hypothetical protein
LDEICIIFIFFDAKTRPCTVAVLMIWSIGRRFIIAVRGQNTLGAGAGERLFITRDLGV